MKKYILFLIALNVFLLNACTSMNQGLLKSSVEAEAAKVKLPSDVVPLKYDLTLWANPSEETFSGTVAIDVSLLHERRDIFLHAEDIEVMSVALEGTQGEKEPRFSQVDDHGLARIDFGDVLPKGTYRVEIAFRVKYRNDLLGLYKVKDADESYLFTQFEPVFARKMLPCFDEPRFKTPFNVKVVSPKGLKVIANNSLKTIIPQQDDEVHVFETTKPLPTYLLALAVGPFDIIEGKSLVKNRFRDREIPFRAIATKGKGAKLRLALQETPRILERLEEYFGIAYPYAKLDIIAIPDFSAGAMENAGAVTFREWYLLVDEKSASVDQRRDFYVVMAHELAHQWFGNTVTMPWWDDLWLNEAFATWLSYKITDQLKPEFKASTRVLEDGYYAMTQDSLLSARKIHEPVNEYHDIHNAFDVITYWKGGATLNMLENYLGSAKFREAVSYHVKRFEDKHATSRDFLESLAKFSDNSLVSSAESFLNQTGVPHVKLDYICTDKSIRIKVEQSRYVPIGSKVSAARQWSVPMCVSYDDDGKLQKHCFTVKDPVAKFDLASKSCPSFVMPNAQGQGYYRFSLNHEAWKNLLSAQTDHLSEGDRLAIADSLVAELYAGGLDFGFVAEGLQSMINQTSVALVRPFLKILKEADTYWVNQENRVHALAFAERALKDVYKTLSAKRDLTSDQISLKKDIARFLADIVKDKEVRLELSLLGTSFLRKTFPNDAHDLSGVSSSSASSGSTSPNSDDLMNDGVAMSLQFESDAALENFVAKLGEVTDTVARSKLLYGLARAREGKDADAMRSLVFNKNLRRNEQLKLFYDHLGNPRNQPDTWQFVKTNWPRLKETLSESQMAHLPYLAQGLCDTAAAKEVNEFFSPVIAQYEGGPRTLAEVTEEIEMCSARKAHATVLANRYFDTVRDQAVVEKERSTP